MIADKKEWRLLDFLDGVIGANIVVRTPQSVI